MPMAARSCTKAELSLVATSDDKQQHGQEQS